MALTLVTVAPLFLVGGALLDFEVRRWLAIVVLTVWSDFGQGQITAGAGVSGIQLRSQAMNKIYFIETLIYRNKQTSFYSRTESFLCGLNVNVQTSQLCLSFLDLRLHFRFFPFCYCAILYHIYTLYIFLRSYRMQSSCYLFFNNLWKENKVKPAAHLLPELTNATATRISLFQQDLL